MEYRVEAVTWQGHDRGASHLQDELNGWAAEGWRLVAIMPTTADTSIRSLMSAAASADTTEFAVVLERTAEG